MLEERRACLNSHPQRAWERAERNEAVRGHPLRSYLKKRVWGPCRILGLASRIGTSGVFCTCHGILVSTSIFGGVHLHQTICYFFPFGQAVRSSQTIKRGATLLLLLLLLPVYTVFFSGCTEPVRFPQPISTNSCGKLYSIRFVPMLSGEGG